MPVALIQQSLGVRFQTYRLVLGQFIRIMHFLCKHRVVNIKDKSVHLYSLLFPHIKY